MEKVKRFLKVQTEPCEHRPRQQVHPQVGRRRRKSRARRDGWVADNKDVDSNIFLFGPYESRFFPLAHPVDDSLEPAATRPEAMEAG